MILKLYGDNIGFSQHLHRIYCDLSGLKLFALTHRETMYSYKSLRNTGDLSLPGTETYQFDSCTAQCLFRCARKGRGKLMNTFAVHSSTHTHKKRKR